MFAVLFRHFSTSSGWIWCVFMSINYLITGTGTKDTTENQSSLYLIVVWTQVLMVWQGISLVCDWLFMTGNQSSLWLIVYDRNQSSLYKIFISIHVKVQWQETSHFLKVNKFIYSKYNIMKSFLKIVNVSRDALPPFL